MQQILTPQPCESCGEMFTPGSLTSRYCSDTCQKRAYRYRRVKRAKGYLPPSNLRVTTAFFAVHMQPTADQLMHTCFEFLGGDPASRQRIFVGTMPADFTLPADLELTEREDKNGWHISHPYRDDLLNS